MACTLCGALVRAYGVARRCPHQHTTILEAELTRKWYCKGRDGTGVSGERRGGQEVFASLRAGGEEGENEGTRESGGRSGTRGGEEAREKGVGGKAEAEVEEMEGVGE
eukprot:1983631-Rhodomonas_salina.1